LIIGFLSLRGQKFAEPVRERMRQPSQTGEPAERLPGITMPAAVRDGGPEGAEDLFGFVTEQLVSLAGFGISDGP